MSFRKCLTAFCISIATCAYVDGANYESYLESWDSNWQNVVQNLPPGPGGNASNSYLGVTLNVSFGCYNVTTTPLPNGISFTDPNLMTVVSYVQTHGGKARLSYGGASYAPPCAPQYFISQTTTSGVSWPNNISALATGVASVVASYSLDGVDLDLEDPQPAGSTPQQFANQLIQFIQALRTAIGPNKTISITIPGQGWNTYWYYLATGAAAVPGLINYISFMEYDIWVNGSGTFADQIEADILTYTSPTNTSPGPNYSPGWGLNPGIVQVGLMPGCDDQAHFLSVADAQTIATRAVTQGLYGVMTWDLNRDSGSVNSPSCSSYPTNYQYSVAIRQNLSGFGIESMEVGNSTQYPTRNRQFVLQNFISQPPPNHGTP